MTIQQNPYEQAKAHAAQGAGLYGAGRFREAMEQFRAAAMLWPEQVDIRYNLALSAWAAGDLSSTRNELTAVLAINPAYAKAHDAVARLAIMDQDAGKAIEASQKAIGLAPREPEFLLTAAAALEAGKRYAESWALLEPIWATPVIAERAAIICARVGRQLHHEQRAIEIASRAIAAPAFNPPQRRSLHFALAALYDQIGSYDQAFQQATLAHSISPPAYSTEARRGEFDLRIDHWTGQRLKSVAQATPRSRQPVFIVGMPRSGTTLVEQILSRHPDVFAAGEVPAMSRMATALDALGNFYPQSLELLKSDEADQLAGVYLHEIDSLNSTKPVFTDKMPLNFMYLDLIDRMLPNARVVHCVRDRRDTCLSCFFTDFATPYDFMSQIEDLDAFYSMYERIMAHWERVVSVPILTVRYEDVVDDLEAQARRLLDFLQLPWDERCLRFYESDRKVSTASKDQVTQPLYRSSIGKWKNYASHLAALQK